MSESCILKNNCGLLQLMSLFFAVLAIISISTNSITIIQVLNKPPSLPNLFVGMHQSYFFSPDSDTSTQSIRQHQASDTSAFFSPIPKSL